ncbi:hypothetical protein SAMN05216218_10385 [Halorientalis regularis]|uniref:Uncharacterized protein n=1 Tax=Halorientalis regularis TaxID=660518 RepID=A0A1G7HMQ9_9EURY|nr:hypothetical protein SAMN05216218_10385 [Halorientalis regularis]
MILRGTGRCRITNRSFRVNGGVEPIGGGYKLEVVARFVAL